MQFSFYHFQLVYLRVSNINAYFQQQIFVNHVHQPVLHLITLIYKVLKIVNFTLI